MKFSNYLTPEQYTALYTVEPGQTGSRLDTFLQGHYRRRSREQIKQAIFSGLVTLKRAQSPHLSAGKLKPSSQLISGDEILVLSVKKAEPEVDFNYTIIYEDDSLFIIDKPPNLPVHPAGSYFFNTLLTHLNASGKTYYLAHRLDKETSGILVLAKTSEFCAALTEQFAARTTEKKYLAIVHGSPTDEFEVNAPLRRDPHSLIGLKMAVAPQEGDCGDGNAIGLPARTLFIRKETFGNFSLLECFPKTGRQHQIRIHLDHSGFPIVGDKLYGRSEKEALQFYERHTLSEETKAKLILPRHALHAAGITFKHPSKHPSSGQIMSFSSDLPEDLKNFVSEQMLE